MNGNFYVPADEVLAKLRTCDMHVLYMETAVEIAFRNYPELQIGDRVSISIQSIHRPYPEFFQVVTITGRIWDPVHNNGWTLHASLGHVALSKPAAELIVKSLDPIDEETHELYCDGRFSEFS